MTLLSSFKKNKASQMERRLEQRHPSHFSALLSQTTEKKTVEEVIVTILNFSKSGLAALAHKAIPSKSIFDLQLAFNSERSINASFKVIQCQEVESGYLVRCEILKPCPQYEALCSKITEPKHSVISECW